MRLKYRIQDKEIKLCDMANSLSISGSHLSAMLNGRRVLQSGYSMDIEKILITKKKVSKRKSPELIRAINQMNKAIKMIEKYTREPI